jgi:flagellar M-ring protein FliF
VTVTDGRGNVLAGGGDEPGAIADDQFAYRQRVEGYLADKAESMLIKVLGSGYCEVRVSAEMLFEDTRETTRTYDPDKKVVVSERIESTKTTGSSARVGGIVGSAANVPEGPNPSQAEGGGQQSTTENIDTEYMVTESVMETVNRGATVQRLTVAAFLDMSAVAGEDGTGGPSKDDISKVIKDAIGFDEKRGDSLMIVESVLNPVTAEIASVGSGVPAWAVKAGQYFAVAVLALVLLVIARRVLKNIESATPRRVMVPDVMGMQGGGPGPANQDDLMRSEISRFVTANPEAAGRMLEGWVEGEE